MEQYNYVFIEMDPCALFNLKNKGSIFQTIRGELVYCSNNIENLNINNIFDKYLVIIKKEKRYNVLSEPNHIFIENTNDCVENNNTPPVTIKNGIDVVKLIDSVRDASINESKVYL